MATCPMCGSPSTSDLVHSLDWDELVHRAHGIIHEDTGYSDWSRVRLDIAAVIVALNRKLSALSHEGSGEW